jgi:hypothetical protein
VIVLFVGEGRHDIGEPGPTPYQPRPARGSIPTPARLVCPAVAAGSIALAWTEIRRFNPSARKHGYEAKIPAAVLLASRRFGCEGDGGRHRP